MEKKKGVVKLTEKAIGNLKLLFGEQQTAQAKIGLYIQGIMDAHNLGGKWNLDTTTWSLNHTPDEPEAKNE